MLAHGARLADLTDDDKQCLRATLDRDHVAVVPGLLCGDALQRVLDGVRNASFVESYNESTSHREQIMDDEPTSALLWYLGSDPRLHRLIEELTGSERVTRFGGRTYRMLPGSGHVGDWHDDAVFGHVAALSISLSEQPFEGGTTIVRDVVTKEAIAEAGGAAMQPGDALILRVRRDLEHRVCEVTGTVPKTSFAGFFSVGPPSPLNPSA